MSDESINEHLAKLEGLTTGELVREMNQCMIREHACLSGRYEKLAISEIVRILNNRFPHGA